MYINYYAPSRPLQQGQVKMTMSSIAQFTIVLLCILIRPSSSECGSRTLTADEFLEISATDLTGSDYCGDKTEAECRAVLAQEWKQLNDDEWEKAKKAYELNGVWFPYLLCHVGQGMTGNKRQIALSDSLNASMVDIANNPSNTLTYIRLIVDKLKVETRLNVAVLSNTEDSFCGVVRLPERFACKMKDLDGKDDVIMQPLHMYMKIAADTIQSVKEALEDRSSALPDPVFAFSLCPGAIDEMNVEATEGIEEDITEEVVQWVLEEADVPDGCDETYKSRITATIEGGNSTLSNDPDTLDITFNTDNFTPKDFNCSVELIKAMADLPTICFVELVQESETDNDAATSITQSGINNFNPIFDAGITGAGQIVAVSDTGLDISNCYFDQSSAPSRIQNNNRRKVVQYISHADSRDDNNGHGTHVCGTIAGFSQEGAKGNGVAKNAKIAFMDIGITGEPFLKVPPDTDLLDTGRGGGEYEDYAHIHSASWGTSVSDSNRRTANGYTTRARNFDNYMFKNDDFLINVAAGNDGQYNVENSVGTPATAKNILSVGAHLNDVNSMNRIASFSSRGPTQDGRRKPDILGPGQGVSSAAGNTACSLTQKSGTSMATPAVSGAAALVREYFEDGWWPQGTKGSGQSVRPSGALVKAVLMNGAQWVSAVNNPSQVSSRVERYDNSQGFGRVSLVDSIYVAGKTNVLLDAYTDIIKDGEEKVYNKTITRTGGCLYPEFRATLVWTDEGAVPSCRNCLVNDLDLLVIKKLFTLDETVYFPNGENKRDTVNNAERVIVENVEEDDVFEIRVKGTNLANPEQKYALVMTGCFNVDGNADSFEFTPPENDANIIKARSIYMAVSVVGWAVISLLL